MKPKSFDAIVTSEPSLRFQRSRAGMPQPVLTFTAKDTDQGQTLRVVVEGGDPRDLDRLGLGDQVWLTGQSTKGAYFKATGVLKLTGDDCVGGVETILSELG